MDVPPKREGEITKESIKEKIDSCIKNDYYISPEDFNKAINLILKDIDLFYKYSGELETLMAVSIDEMDIIEEDDNYLQSGSIEIKDSTIQKIQNEIESYLGNLFSQYDGASFEKKIKIISFLDISYTKLLFVNNNITREMINDFFIEILEKEKKETGNYYIYSHLNALNNNNESQGYVRISPNQFIVNKLTQEVDSRTQNLHNQTKSFISNSNDFEKIKILLRELGDIEKEDFKTNKEQVNHFKKISDKEEEINQLFSTPVDESLFKVAKSNSDNSFLDHNFFLYKSVRDNFKERSGFSLEETTIPEQYNYFEFTKEITNKEAEKFFNFLKTHGKNAFRTFLSIEQGGKEMGDKILTLGNAEKLPKELSDKIFMKYADIINTVDNCEEEIKKIFGNKEIPSKIFISVKETLLKRGAKMLSDLADKVRDPKFEVNEKEILEELSEIKEEAIILGESYVGLYKEGIRVPIEEVTTMKETTTEKLTEEQKKELMNIYEKGRPKVTYESKEHLEFLKKEFEEELNNKDISVNEICFKDQTIIIALIDKKDKDNFYIGGLTFVEEVKNAVVAEAALNQVFRKFKDKNIRGLVDSRNPLLTMYLKRFGFKITKKLESEEEIKNNGGEIYYEIEKSKEMERVMLPERDFQKAA